jgi:hypothetical protein
MERNRLIQKMIAEKKSGAPMAPATPSYHIELSCGDHDRHDGLLTIDEGGDDQSSTN